MKKSFLLAAFVAALALTGCQKQSELKFDDIQTYATIQGRVKYEPGYKLDDKELPVVRDAALKEGVTVVAKIAYSEYDGKAVGTKQIKAVTDANGVYMLSIPVGQKAITVSVAPAGFWGDYIEYEYDIEEKDYRRHTYNAFFEDNSTRSVAVLAGEEHVVADFEMSPSIKY